MQSNLSLELLLTLFCNLSLELLLTAVFPCISLFFPVFVVVVLLRCNIGNFRIHSISKLLQALGARKPCQSLPLPGPRSLAAPRYLRRSLPACASSTAAIFVPREGACPGMPRRFLSLPARTLSQDKAPPPVARLNRWHPPRTSHARSPPTSVLYVCRMCALP